MPPLRTIAFAFITGAPMLANADNILIMPGGAQPLSPVANPDGNTVTVDITGDRNGGDGSLTPRIDGFPAPGVIVQTGRGNSLAVSVIGDDNLFAVSQVGVGNVGSISLSGAFNQAYLAQVGDGNVAAISQSGSGNFVAIWQSSQ